MKFGLGHNRANIARHCLVGPVPTYKKKDFNRKIRRVFAKVAEKIFQCDPKIFFAISAAVLCELCGKALAFGWSYCALRVFGLGQRATTTVEIPPRGRKSRFTSAHTGRAHRTTSSSTWLTMFS